MGIPYIVVCEYECLSIFTICLRAVDVYVLVCGNQGGGRGRGRWGCLASFVFVAVFEDLDDGVALGTFAAIKAITVSQARANVEYTVAPE